MGFWENKKVIITWRAGFLSSYILEKLKQRKCSNIFVPLVEEYDLTKGKIVIRLYQDYPADIVIHLAVIVAGICTFYLSNKIGSVGVVYGLIIAGIIYALWCGIIAVKYYNRESWVLEMNQISRKNKILILCPICGSLIIRKKFFMFWSV